MKTQRSDLRLQIFRNNKWQWIFCWANGCRIITTERPRAAIEDIGTNLVYFSNKTTDPIRSFDALKL